MVMSTHQDSCKACNSFVNTCNTVVHCPESIENTFAIFLCCMMLYILQHLLTVIRQDVIEALVILYLIKQIYFYGIMVTWWDESI